MHRLPSGDSAQGSYDTSVNTLTNPLNTALCIDSHSNSYAYTDSDTNSDSHSHSNA
mgnify:CR=1 FL=1